MVSTPTPPGAREFAFPEARNPVEFAFCRAFSNRHFFGAAAVAVDPGVFFFRVFFSRHAAADFRGRRERARAHQGAGRHRQQQAQARPRACLHVRHTLAFLAVDSSAVSCGRGGGAAHRNPLAPRKVPPAGASSPARSPRSDRSWSLLLPVFGASLPLSLGPCLSTCCPPYGTPATGRGVLRRGRTAKGALAPGPLTGGRAEHRAFGVRAIGAMHLLRTAACRGVARTAVVIRREASEVHLGTPGARPCGRAARCARRHARAPRGGLQPAGDAAVHDAMVRPLHPFPNPSLVRSDFPCHPESEWPWYRSICTTGMSREPALSGSSALQSGWKKAEFWPTSQSRYSCHLVLRFPGDRGRTSA